MGLADAIYKYTYSSFACCETFVTMHFATVTKYSVGVLPIKSRLLFRVIFELNVCLCLCIYIYYRIVFSSFLSSEMCCATRIPRPCIPNTRNKWRNTIRYKKNSNNNNQTKSFTLEISIHIIVSKNERH